MRKALVILAILGTTGIAQAADQSILGKMLSVKDPSEGTDPTRIAVSVQAQEDDSPDMIVGDPTVSGGRLEVYVHAAATDYAQVFELPQGTAQKTGKPFWSADGTTGFKYMDSAGEQGPVTSASISRSASGRVSVKAKVSGKKGLVTVVAPDPGESGCVALRLGSGNRYSVQFGADSTITNNGKKLFSAKKPASEGICVDSTTTTTLPDPCLASNGGCDPLTTCENVSGDALCGPCPGGYNGSGSSSCIDINECATNNGGCVGGFACANLAGGSSCNDINECATSNGGCAAQAVCTNVTGSRTCDSCNIGFTGDPYSTCIDINECATSNGGCTTGFFCANSPGTYNCNDINECATNNGGCAVQSVCTNTAGSRTCNPCNTGYTGNPVVSCTDINECATSNGGCGSGYNCANSPGNYSCNDINECATNNGGCTSGMTCTNTTGGFNCF